MKNCQCLCFTGVRRDCEIHNEILRPQPKKINRINFHFPRGKKTPDGQDIPQKEMYCNGVGHLITQQCSRQMEYGCLMLLQR